MLQLSCRGWMMRRWFGGNQRIGFTLLLVSCLVGILLVRCSRAPGFRRTPNLLLICLDAVRFDTFWLPETSGLSDDFTEWADRALRFERAQSTASWTLPAVASVLSGLYPEQHGAGKFDHSVADLNTMVPSGLADNIPTLATILRSHGHRTACFSGHPWMDRGSFGLSRGFDESHREPEDLPLISISSRWLEEKLARPDGRPFFLNLHLMGAHNLPSEPLEAIRDRVEGMPFQLEERARGALSPQLDPSLEPDLFLRYLEYVRAVTELRGQVASLLSTVDRLGLLSETVVLLYSDHGEEVFDHRLTGEREGLGTIFGVGHGHTLFQELLHIPMLAWVPARPGQKIDVSSSLVDVLPTLLSLMDVEIDGESHWPGRDLTPYFHDSEGSNRAPARPLFSSGIAYGAEQFAVLWYPWKLIRLPSRGKEWTYNLEFDPGETDPLLGVEPEVQRSLSSLLDQYQALAPSGTAGPPHLTPEQIRSLEALGYLGKVRQR